MKQLKYIIKWVIGLVLSLKYLKKDTQYIIADGHIGEIVYTCSMTPALMSLRDDITAIEIITTPKYAQIVELYKSCYRKIHVVKPRFLIECLVTYADSELNHRKIKWGWKWYDSHFYNDVPETYIAGFLYKVRGFGIPYSTPHSLITDRIPDNDPEVKDYIEKSGIVKGKTVILIPKAQSARMFPEDYWRRIAKVMRENGYKVMTNVKDESEAAIDGTEPVSIPLRIVINVVDYAGYAISTRCGLTDLLAVGNCNVDTIYYIKDETDVTVSGYWSWKLGKESVLYTQRWFIHNEDDFDEYLKHLKQKSIKKGGC